MITRSQYVMFCISMACISRPALSETQESFATTRNMVTSVATTIKKSVIDQNGTILFITQDNTYQEYGLARFSTAANTCESLIRQKVMMNYEADKKNPLYGAIISDINLASPRIFVASQELPTVYGIENVKADSMSMIASIPLADADGNICSGVIKLASGKTGNTFVYTGTIKDEKLLEKEVAKKENYSYQQTTFLIAAVKPQHGEFGQPGSGLALMQLVNDPIKKEVVDPEDGEITVRNEDRFGLRVFNATKPSEFKPWIEQKRKPESSINAYPIDITSPAFSINNGLGSIAPNSIVMTRSDKFDRFYVGLNVTTSANADETQGACALATARVKDDRILLDAFASPETTGPNSIFTVTGANKQVSVHAIKELVTSTGLHYLVVVGGPGNDAVTKKQVFAVPVAVQNISTRNVVHAGYITLLDEPGHGTTQNINRKPEHLYHFGRRTNTRFNTPATTYADMPTTTMESVRVGGSVALPGNILDVEVEHDAVFVVTEKNDSSAYAIFRSQPIYNEEGLITHWTNWQPALMMQHDTIINYRLIPSLARALYLTNNIETHSSSFRQTNWVGASTDAEKNQSVSAFARSVTNLIAKELPSSDGGVQGLFDFGPTTPGLANKNSLICATGLKKIVLIETGQVAQAGLIPHEEDITATTLRNTNGNLDNIEPGAHRAIVLSGGVLDELGPITSAAIVSNETNSWLAVGGVYGTALLARPNGSGWSTQRGLGKQFADTLPYLRMTKISNKKFVKKLVAYHDSLFIVTSGSIDRCNCEDPDNIVTIASAKNLPGSGAFTDLCMTDGYAFLGTTKGMFVTESILPDSTIQNQIVWRPSECQGMDKPIVQINSMSITGDNRDLVNGGQLFVLTGSADIGYSNVLRLYIKKNDAGTITVKNLPEHQLTEKIVGMITCRAYRSIFATDGATNFSAHSGNKTAPTKVYTLSNTFLPGTLSGGGFGNHLSIPLPENGCINAIIRNSATGSWCVAGDFGLFIQE